jgi:HIRAN domain
MKASVCFSVAGTRHYRAASLRAAKALAPGLELKLEHQPHNKFDANAVAVLVKASGDMLGHVPREQAADCVQLIRSGKLLSAEVSKVFARKEKISIDVTLTIEKDPREVRARLYTPPKPPDFRYMPYGGAFYEPSKYSKLEKLFGDAVEALRDSFLGLSDADLECIFADYALAYNENAANYARMTYPSWKYGRVKLSGETMERLIAFAPRRLAPDVRMSLLRSVLAQNRKTVPTRRVEIEQHNPSAGLQDLENALASMSHRDVLAFLPERVMEAATWLYDDDITAARAILAQAEHQENDLLRRKAAGDIAMLRNLISTRALTEASYQIELPTGALDVAVVKHGLLSRMASMVCGKGARR